MVKISTLRKNLSALLVSSFSSFPNFVQSIFNQINRLVMKQSSTPLTVKALLAAAMVALLMLPTQDTKASGCYNTTGGWPNGVFKPSNAAGGISATAQTTPLQSTQYFEFDG